MNKEELFEKIAKATIKIECEGNISSVRLK